MPAERCQSLEAVAFPRRAGFKWRRVAVKAQRAAVKWRRAATKAWRVDCKAQRAVAKAWRRAAGGRATPGTAPRGPR